MESHGGGDRDRDGEDSADQLARSNGGGIGIDDDEQKQLSSSSPVPLGTTKGKGLKKWRRIQRRAIGNDTSSTGATIEDLNRVLKRDSRGGSALPVVPPSSTPTTHGGDSDNSEDPGSKSSTAASAPKFRYPLPAPTPGRHRHSFHSSKQQNNRIESTKKPRGGGEVILDKELSYSSSIESDLRAPNGGFFPEITNGRPLTYEVDNSSDAQASDQQSNDYFFKDNGEEEEASQDNDPASWQAKEELSHNQPPSTTFNLLAQSLFSLQEVHDALQKEIQNFREIGHEAILLPDDSSHHFLLNPKFQSAVPEVHETNPSGPVCSKEREKTCSLPPEAELLERKLEEVMTKLEVKESRVIELEGILIKKGSLKGEVGSSLQSLKEKLIEMETELEDLFKKKIEAEVEWLATRKIPQKLKVAAEDGENVALHKSRSAESNDVVRKEEVDAEEVVKIQSGICKYSFCFSIQLMLLCLALGLSLLQLWPGSTGFVPT